MATFILSDDSINESGFRLLTKGIDITQFKKNPVMFWNHHRSSDWSNPDKLPIGIWKAIKKEGTRLVADDEIDEDDELGAKVANKVKKNHLKAVSVGIRVLETSTDPKHLKKGQTRPTITRCKLLEASLVDIPRNGNALKLYIVDEDEEGTLLNLSEKGNEQIFNQILPLINLQNSDMKIVSKFLKLGENASEADVLAAVTELQNALTTSNTKNETLSATITQLKEAGETEKCEALVQKAVDDKKITLSQKENWLSIAKANYDSAKLALDGMTGFTSIDDTVDSSSTDTHNLGDAEKYEAQWKAGKLKSWKSSNPTEFARCELAYYDAEADA